MFLLVGAQLIIPWIIGLLVDDLTATSLSNQTLTKINQFALIVLVVFIVRSVMTFLRSYMAHIAGWGVVADLRRYVYDHLQRLSLRFYEDKQTGQMMSRS